MNREDKRQIAAQLVEHLKHRQKDHLVVDIRRTMQGHEAETIERELLPKTREEFLRFWQKLHERVNHDVTDKKYLLGRNAFALEILISVRRRCEQQIGELICYKPVDLLRHLAIERP